MFMLYVPTYQFLKHSFDCDETLVKYSAYVPKKITSKKKRFLWVSPPCVSKPYNPKVHAHTRTKREQVASYEQFQSHVWECGQNSRDTKIFG